MPRFIVMLACLVAVGCGAQNVPTAKYFSGEPVDHWLKEAKSADPKARRKAVEVLGNVGPADPEAVPALAAALKDKDASVRDAAVLALSKIGTPAASAEAALREATADSHPKVREHAATARDRVRGNR